MKPTKELAREIAAKIAGNPSWSDVRDRVDIATGSGLDCTQLDLMTDWVTHECDKRAGCDCEAPYGDGPNLVSNECPVHNHTPDVYFDDDDVAAATA